MLGELIALENVVFIRISPDRGVERAQNLIRIHQFCRLTRGLVINIEVAYIGFHQLFHHHAKAMTLWSLEILACGVYLLIRVSLSTEKVSKRKYVAGQSMPPISAQSPRQASPIC